LFALEETFHTEGFYKRESTLVSALLGQLAAQSGSLLTALPRSTRRPAP
jgi:hypothetical protein